MPAGIDAVDRVVVRVNVFVKARRIGTESFEGIHRPEAASIGVLITGAQVIEAEIEIKLLAAEEVNVRSTAAGRDEVAEGVVVVNVGDLPRRVGEKANAVVAIVAVKVRDPLIVDELILAEQGEAVSVGSVDRCRLRTD